MMNLLEKIKNSLSEDVEEMMSRSLRVMSFNVRWDEKKEEVPKWSIRKLQVASMIRFHRVDVVGLQESLFSQLIDLQQILSDYEYFGHKYHQTDLDNPILFRRGRFCKLQGSYFYLSPTPDVPSRGWNAKFLRSVTWLKLKDKKTQKTFFIFNTHFDYHSFIARNQSAILLKKKIAAITEGFPFLVTGDFNLFPELGGEDTYRILTNQRSERPLLDAQSVAKFPHHGPTGTWSGFKEAGQPGIKPDYIFVDNHTKVLSHGILADSFDGCYPSDHLPVVADILF